MYEELIKALRCRSRVDGGVMARCKHPDSVCANMTLLDGVAYCDSVPCSLRDELPEPTNADRIRAMSDEELAEYFAKTFCHGYGQPQLLDWLQQPAPEVSDETDT